MSGKWLVVSIVFIAVSSVEVESRGQFFRDRPRPTGDLIEFEHAGQKRSHRIHLPSTVKGEKKPSLVLCLHGGGGNSGQVSAMGLTKVADRHGFIVVYPDAINKHWNDGRRSQRFTEHDKTIDDVDFLMSVVERVCSEHDVNRDRIFAMGMSNGGFMAQRLAMEESNTFSAVGIVVASMAKPLKDVFNPSCPVSVLFLNGTEDKLVPYDGGEVQVNLFPRLNRLRRQSTNSRGYCLSTDEAIELWRTRNHLVEEPVVTTLPDKSANDESTVELSLWEGGEQGTAVALYKVVGGGHTMPGRKTPALPERFVGKTNEDIDGFEVIWSFFEKHARKSKSSPPGDTVSKKSTVEQSLPWVTEKVSAQPLDFVVFNSPTAGSDVSYHIYKPPLYQRNQTMRFPVLYWLHGTEGGVGGVRPLTRLFHEAMVEGKIEPMLVVFVNGLPRRLWSDSKDGVSPVESVFINDVIPNVDKSYRTIADRRGRFLEGFSMGGFGAARIGMKHSNQFAAISILGAGPLDPDFQGPRAKINAPLKDAILRSVCSGDMQYFKEINPWQVADENSARLKSKNLRIRQVVGGQDSSLMDNRDFHQHLDNLGVSHEFIVLPDVGHDTRDVLRAVWILDSEFYSSSR